MFYIFTLFAPLFEMHVFFLFVLFFSIFSFYTYILYSFFRLFNKISINFLGIRKISRKISKYCKYFDTMFKRLSGITFANFIQTFSASLREKQYSSWCSRQVIIRKLFFFFFCSGTDVCNLQSLSQFYIYSDLKFLTSVPSESYPSLDWFMIDQSR